MATRATQKPATPQGPNEAGLRDDPKRIHALAEYGIRRSKAQKTGRVTNRIPTYIGTWDIEDPSFGLFEMFIKTRHGQHISGTIEDVLGSATFEGTVDGNKIRFSKRYDWAAVSICASPEIVHYSGTQNAGNTSGEYHFKGDKTYKRPFIMREFTQESMVYLNY